MSFLVSSPSYPRNKMKDMDKKGQFWRRNSKHIIIMQRIGGILSLSYRVHLLSSMILSSVTWMPLITNISASLRTGNWPEDIFTVEQPPMFFTYSTLLFLNVDVDVAVVVVEGGDIVLDHVWHALVTCYQLYLASTFLFPLHRYVHSMAAWDAFNSFYEYLYFYSFNLFLGWLIISLYNVFRYS